MDPEFVSLVFALVQGPSGPASISRQEFLGQVGEHDGTALAHRLLLTAIGDRSPLGVEVALILGSVFGVNEEFVGPLSALVTEDWHVSHEDAVSLLDKLRVPATIPALLATTEWVPSHLQWDKAHAFGRKAVYALSKLGNTAALDALARIATENPWEPIVSLARAKLSAAQPDA